MSQPPGFTDRELTNHVCRLHKSLYGLKQAPRAWFEKLTQFLLSQNFLQSKNDTSLFICHTDNIHLFVLIYVDDILITGNSSFHITELITTLGKAFSLKDLGHLNYFLGVEVIPHAFGVILSQQ